ncbi:hypothetical protein GFL49_36050 [Rhizobium leguminosarum bv. viciae]|nr:hypothetical protein [Rhizobium leguminosarum bv. viciae]
MAGRHVPASRNRVPGCRSDRFDRTRSGVATRRFCVRSDRTQRAEMKWRAAGRSFVAARGMAAAPPCLIEPANGARLTTGKRTWQWRRVQLGHSSDPGASANHYYSVFTSGRTRSHDPLHEGSDVPARLTPEGDP